ncbi:MAG: hypothetical protein EPN20_12065 [Magnetospirillum sp.]|nr:MAG: hypothetical protein EPN20_12065 [Magnetospirillum sp.]
MRIVVIALSALLVALSATAAERHWLITPEEVAAAGRSAAVDMLPMMASQGSGPQIVVYDPKLLDRLRSPVSIMVEFLPGASGLAPDMASLTVTLRGFISIDITDRLRQYLAGMRLAVEGADLPTGNHRIRMVVADTAGNLSARDLVLAVVEGPR